MKNRPANNPTARVQPNPHGTERLGAVLCCYRGALAGHMGSPSDSAHAHAPMNRPEWHEFWAVLAGLRDRCPPALPVVIRTFRHPETVLGLCLRREKRFLVLLNRNLGEPQAIEVLCHEWAHALAWNCLLDRLSEMPGIDPVKFNRTSHDETWGCAYSQVWRAYLGGHLGEG